VTEQKRPYLPWSFAFRDELTRRVRAEAQFVIPLDTRPPTITVTARRINAPGLLRGWSALYLATTCW
jgi:hypothetical protein